MAGGHGKIHEHPNAGINDFSKRPDEAGRKRKLISHINAGLKDEGYRPATNEEIREAYLTLINLPLSKIQDISSTKNDEYPLLYKLVAKEMMGKRGFEMMEKVLDRAIGKAPDKIDVTSKGDKISGVTYVVKRGDRD